MNNVTNLINPNFRAFDIVLKEGEGPFLYRKDELLAGIEKWTSIILSNTNVKNPKIGLTHEVNFEYMCILYAALNVGANLIILEARYQTGAKHDTFLPLDLMIIDHIDSTQPHIVKYFTEVSTVIIDCDKVGEYTNHVAEEFDQSQYTMISATSSGTTEKPKEIPHYYNYMLKMAKRNADVFKFAGRTAHTKILHHGSSLPAYFLPAILSPDANMQVNLPYPVNIVGKGGWSPALIGDVLDSSFTCWLEYLDINHILLSYVEMAEDVLKSIHRRNAYFTDLTIYVLTYIRPEWYEYIKGRNIKIVSLFGSTESCGTVMVSELNNTNADTFDNTIYRSLDDCFIITTDPDGTRLQNEYIDVVVGDIFEDLGNNQYRHLGRADKCRINDVDLNLTKILSLVEKLNINGQLIVDTVMGKLYLALWDNNLDIKQTSYIINKQLATEYSQLVQISKCLHLDKPKYMSGIKLNMDFLRQDFRTGV